MRWVVMILLFSYAECLQSARSDYQIKKQIQAGKLFQIEKGIYSDEAAPSTLSIISKKYPHAIITMDSAFYYHGLTDVIPEQYCLATGKHYIALVDTRVRQFYVNSDLLHLGETEMTRRDATFRIYDKERMLIELLRYKNKIPYDLYKEILAQYRDIVHTLDIERIQEYVPLFPKANMIENMLDAEVF